MSSRVQQLVKKGLISPPPWLPSNIHYEALTGSASYGTSSDTSDVDLVGFAVPTKEEVFPHLRGEINGFGRQKKRFGQYQQHHIKDDEARKEYDVTIYGIVKFFSLCMENNPNMVDVLFVPTECILYSSMLGQMVREKRHIFLHKGGFHKYKGYSYSQQHKMRSKNPEGKRIELVRRFGYDVKFAMNLVRLLLEIEQIMTEGDLDLQRHREQLKSIRRGEWTLEEVEKWASEKEAVLEKVYHECTILPYGPREEEIRQLLYDCLEHHYGSLDKCVVDEGRAVRMLRQIKDMAEKGLGE